MVRRVGGGEYRPTYGSPSSAVSVREKRRVDRLAETIDQCSAAKDAADVLGEKFLAYLLAMAIEEARAAMRSDLTKEPRFMPAREGRAKS